MRFNRRIRLSTFLLLIPVLALLLGLYLVKRRQAETFAAVAVYRQPRTEGVYDVLDEVIALTYANGASLEDLLKETKARTTGKAKLKSGMPIYVDPVGLQEAKQSMTSVVKRPESADQLPLGEHLRRVLKPLGLIYEVKDGFLMITSEEALDVAGGPTGDPYLKYRDVLR